MKIVTRAITFVTDAIAAECWSMEQQHLFGGVAATTSFLADLDAAVMLLLLLPLLLPHADLHLQRA